MATRQARENAKKQNELNTRILTEMLQEPANKFCAECGSKGASWPQLFL